MTLNRLLVLPTLCTALATNMIGCGTNTTLDDGAYRTIGNSEPRNPHKEAPDMASMDPSASFDPKEGFSADAGLSFENTLSGNMFKSGSPTKKSGHVVRYGHDGVIEKIVKIANIHCQPQQFKIRTDKQSFWGEKSGVLTQCTYQFPEFCGAHVFSLLSYDHKEVMIYSEPESPYYVIDTLEGTHASKPGLWDKDDHLGSRASNMGYLFDNNYSQNLQAQQNAPFNLGWTIKASHHDEAIHGKHYHRAVEEVTACF